MSFLQGLGGVKLKQREPINKSQLEINNLNF